MSNSVGANSFLNSPHIVKTIGPAPATERGRHVHIYTHPKLPLLIYPSRKFIVVKNYLDPSQSFIYRGHTAITTVAKFSPNGNWVASADVSGKVRVWAWDNPEHLTKIEVPVFSNAVFDLDWDNESKKIVAAGEGSTGQLVKCFQYDTGSNAGEMMGHTKRALTVAYKPSRPFRVFSGGEDMRSLFFTGPPFKLDHSNNNSHTNFINCIRYSSDGKRAFSVSSDKSIVIYDGATGNPIGKQVNAHDGGIYAASFSPDSQYVSTVSADKKIKVWKLNDVAGESEENSVALELVKTLEVVADSTSSLCYCQVGATWNADYLITLSLNGDINLFPGKVEDLLAASGPSKIISDHQESISALYFDTNNDTLFTGSIDGAICTRKVQFDPSAAVATGNLNIAHANETHPLTISSTNRVQSNDKNLKTKSPSSSVHNGKVFDLYSHGNELISVGWDDYLRSSINSEEVSSISLSGQPVSLSVSATHALIVTLSNVSLYQLSGSQFSEATLLADVSTSALSITPTSGSINNTHLAIGNDKGVVKVFTLNDFIAGNLTGFSIEGRTPVSSLAFNPTESILAIGDNGHNISIYQLNADSENNWDPIIRNKWVFHTSRITALAWCPSGRILASGSSDEHIFLWNLNKPMKKQQFTLAHPGGVTGLSFGHYKEEEKKSLTLFSSGNDQVIGIWKIPEDIYQE